MLAQLLQVKQRRECSARQQVMQCTAALHDAEEQLQSAQQALIDYIQWRQGKETQLFSRVQRKVVDVDQLEQLNLKIGLLRQQDVQLQQAVEQAERQRDITVSELRQARQTHTRLLKAAEKTEQLLSREHCALRLQLEYREEQEQEEFTRQRVDC